MHQLIHYSEVPLYTFFTCEWIQASFLRASYASPVSACTWVSLYVQCMHSVCTLLFTLHTSLLLCCHTLFADRDRCPYARYTLQKIIVLKSFALKKFVQWEVYENKPARNKKNNHAHKKDYFVRIANIFSWIRKNSLPKLRDSSD